MQRVIGTARCLIPSCAFHLPLHPSSLPSSTASACTRSLVHLCLQTGSLYQVRILGALGLIDGGETDWKLLAVRTDDPLAATLHGASQLHGSPPQPIAGATCCSLAPAGICSASSTLHPTRSFCLPPCYPPLRPPADIKGAPASIRRLMDDVRTWFRMYKVPEGKPENEFAFDGAWQDRDTALAIVDSTHRQWRALVQRSTDEQTAAARRTEFGEAPAIKGEWDSCCTSCWLISLR